MIVVDTNIIVYYLIRGKRTKAAHDLWNKDPQWVVPPLWRAEFMNVLAVYTARGGLTEAECLNLLDNAMAVFVSQEAAVPARLVMETALSSQITAYDSFYVSLARSMNIPLITEDRELLQKFPSLAFTIKEFISL